MSSKNKAEHPHILYLPKWYPNRYDPMPGLFIKRHGISVSEFTKISVLYIHLDEKLATKTYDINITHEEGLNTIRIYVQKSSAKLKPISSFINSIRYLKAHLTGLKLITTEFGQPDLIHVHVLTRLGILAMLYKVFTGTPFLITEHWTRYLSSKNDFNGFIRKLLSKWVVKNASAILPVTEDLKNAMINHQLHNDNYQIIPNVVDTTLFVPTKTKKQNKQKQLIHLSCFTNEQKNISGILRVLKKLSDTRNDFKCSLVGDGEDFEELNKYAFKLGLTDDIIKFTGLLEGKELVSILSNSDIMLMFSNHENLPVVILESYACGVPVISTNVGGIKEHLNQDLGKLIPSKDEEALYQEISNYLDNPNTFDSLKIRKYAENHFSQNVIGKKLYTIYSSILEKRKIAK